MDKIYAPRDIEQRLYREWEESGCFAPRGARRALLHHDPAAERDRHAAHGPRVPGHHHGRADPLPPHAGRRHAVAGRHRPRRHRDPDGGRAPAECRWQARRDLGREAFVDACGNGRPESGGTIVQQLRRLGASVDWSRERFTMDEGLSRGSHRGFVRLHEEGLIYRGQRLVNWDPVLLTALSDLEVLSTEEDGSLWHLRYPLEDGSGHLRSPRRGRKRCSATPPSPCIRRTSATRT